MRTPFVIVTVILAIALPALAGDVAPTAAAGPCNLSGVWYGGSNPLYPFIFTFSPIPGNRYTSVAALGYDSQQLGYTWWTDWIGEVTFVSPGVYDSWGLSLWMWDPAAAEAMGVDGSFPELEIVHSRIEFIDCNTFVSKIDVYASYFAWTIQRVPFLAPVDLSWLPEAGSTLDETYYRMPRWESDAPKHAWQPRTLEPMTDEYRSLLSKIPRKR